MSDDDIGRHKGSTNDGDFGEKHGRTKRPRLAAAQRLRRQRSNEDDEQNDLDENVNIDDGLGSSLNDGYGPDLMGDQEDRKHLLSLPEVEREKILFERAERRQAMLERMDVQRRLQVQQSSSIDDRKIVSKTRSVKSKTRKSLTKLKARRANKGRGRRARRDGEGLDDEEEEDEESERNDDSLATDDGQDEDSDEDRFIDRSWDSEDVEEEEEEETSDVIKESLPLALQDLNDMRVSRRRLAMWIHFPFFDTELKGLLVRVGLGYSSRGESIYHAAEIVDIKRDGKIYTLEHTQTNKTIVLRSGGHLRTFPMSHVSNSEFTFEEFERWTADQKKATSQTLSPEEARARVDRFQKLRSRSMTHEEIDAAIAEQVQLGLRPSHNLALDQASLARQKDIAVTENDVEEIHRLEERMAILEKETNAKHAKESHRLDEISKINQRNKLKNLMDVRIEQQQNFSKNVGSSRDELDPFARRRCRPDLMSNSPITLPTALTDQMPLLKEIVKDGGAISGQPNDELTALHASLDIDIDFSSLISARHVTK